MTSERWQQIERVLHAALACRSAERSALLDRECAGDENLRQQVESLLASAQQLDGFLETDACSDGAPLFASNDSDLLTGRQFGHYLIETKLGSGGGGEVYLATDTRLGRKVALKLLDSALADESQWRSRFLREARLASRLDHPNICTIHEVGEAEGRLFISMQYVEGETLRRVIDKRPLALDNMLSIALQIADAVATAHRSGIIHRDVKADNIKVTPQGEVKVLDFGLAKLLESQHGQEETDVTMTGAVLGTATAMSPEQARGQRVDHRSDIFSFGCVLYEMATGRVPFDGKTRIDVISSVLKEPHTPAAKLNPELPALLSAIIDRTLQKDPGERYQTMADVIADLRNVVAEAGGRDHLFRSSGIRHSVLTRGVTQQSRMVHSLRRWSQTAIAIGAVVLVIGVTLYWMQRAPGLSSAPIKSIAVLPFRPLVANSGDEALELGMADTLIARLSNIREINVRPINAVRKYTSFDQDSVAAGREQRVDAVVDGQIQRAGEKIRVTVRLVRVRDEAMLWTGQFDEEMSDIFTVQDSITERITAALAVTLTAREQESLAKRQTNNAEAYLLYIRGRYHLNQLTDDGFMKGRNYFQQAIDRDPTYATAYAGLSEAYNRLSGWNALAPADGFPKARQAALTALQLDDSSAEAHTQLATVQLLHYWDWTGAEREYKRALEINPSNADAHQAYANYLSVMGRFDEALAEMNRARELEPLSLEKLAGIGDILYARRRYDAAIEQYQKALEMDPNSGYAHWAIGNAYLQKGMHEQAIAAYKKSIPLSGDGPDETASLAYACAITGKSREATALLQELQARSRERYISPVAVAWVYAGLGQMDRAFTWLDKAFEERDMLLVLLRVEPMFDRLRSDPRFADLVRRVGLPE